MNYKSPTPRIILRRFVYEPLQTGLIAIDLMIPIGHGQQELIIGGQADRENCGSHRYNSQSTRAKCTMSVYHYDILLSNFKTFLIALLSKIPKTY